MPDDDPSFDITHEGDVSESLLIGIAEFGMAGVTAIDYLTQQLEFEKTGHVTTEDLPSITPFDEGVPRHHTRFFSRDDVDVTVLLGELFVPLWAARSFSDAVLDWADAHGVEEIAFLSGVPIPHGPEQHEVFYVATEDYRERRLSTVEMEPMGAGFLEGVHAEVISRGLDSPLAVGVYETPVHPTAQDVDAAIRLVESVGPLYGLDVATEQLAEYGEELTAFYGTLAERIREMQEAERGERDVPADRAYM
mgnify:CR=1 FL=1